VTVCDETKTEDGEDSAGLRQLGELSKLQPTRSVFTGRVALSTQHNRQFS